VDNENLNGEENFKKNVFFDTWPYITNVVFMNVLFTDEILNFFYKIPRHD
jgi:hypothetical protein